MRSSLLASFGLAVLTAAAPAHRSSDLITNTTLATASSGPFNYYRIVSLQSLGNGVVLAAFDGRPTGADAPAPNSILQRRSTDYGATWGSLTYIAEGQAANAGTGALAYGFSDPSYVYDSATSTLFNFHVFSKDASFASSVLGHDDTSRNITSAEVSVSTDGGLSWSTDPTNQPNLPPVASSQVGVPPLLTSAVKPNGSPVGSVSDVGAVLGEFAASGQGIQLQYGAHAGRLIQQYLGRVVQPSGSVAYQAYSVYSDDHGATWQMGTPTGVGMDENKVVELSNGTVMLNSRPSDGSGYRKVALSNDGGLTYTTPRTETQLPDPACNGQISRLYPSAAENSAQAKILLFTNANSKTSRANGTARFSCDDGNTWSTGTVFSPGATSYSTITPLGDGTVGLFYEGLNNQLIYLRVDTAWLGINC
ncbi:sialidase-1 [Sporothrix brasiliensis 5110]|uniref:Sialidase-1 n=1 Tax=Sporothrix brasiliensis 5110 TaxID=1398154 RepID=A0A0C2ISK9_9PEZI|nr:sialidase-1 [Sporothrix brasiliensis 5110]KIH89835.1 sialidase-1 [Sporothrix brasiliensis 5110]